MNEKKSRQAYRIVDVHTFSPSYNSLNDEKFFLYLPLTIAEYDGKSVDGFKSCIPDLEKSRDHLSSMFTDQLSDILKPNMTPRQKMKAIVSSSYLKASELSLWVTYTLAYLSPAEKTRLASEGKILLLNSDNPESVKTVLEKERNEQHQDFRLLQFRLSWIEKGRRKSAWSKVNPLTKGEWFPVLTNHYGKDIEDFAPKIVPKLRISDEHVLSKAAEERVEKFISNWQDVIKQRYELARLVIEANNFSYEESSNLFLKDKLINDLDTLIDYELSIRKTPDIDSMISEAHTNLMLKFLNHTEEQANTIAYGNDSYKLNNIRIERVIYDLADNHINPDEEIIYE